MMEIDTRIVGKNLLRIMGERNLSFRKLSRLTDVPITSLQGYVYFKAYPTSKQLQKIAKGLEIEVGELFKE